MRPRHTLIQFTAAAGMLLAVASSGLKRAPSPPILPDASITPGDALDVTKEDICVPGYSRKVRNVPQAVKKQAYANYGIKSHAPGEYEVDHLISLELGGSNSIKNLWPESFKTHPWNAHVKDALENRLHEEICSGQTDIKQAQQEIAKDWIAAYKKRFKSALPVLLKNGQKGKDASASAAGQVWVNTRSGVYWRPGTQYYGKTKQGKYLTEAEAIKQGYRAAKGQ